MAHGIGKSNIEDEIKSMRKFSNPIKSIPKSEYAERVKKASVYMSENSIDAIFLSCSINLRYFTNLNIQMSERLHSALIDKNGNLVYIVPSFEKEKTESIIIIKGKIFTWEEHENPACTVMDCFSYLGITQGRVLIDEYTPYFIFDALKNANRNHLFLNAQPLTKACREVKSKNELALIQNAMTRALEVQKRTSRILRAGITTSEVQDFVSLAHQKLGFETPPEFNIVLFGEATAYPHGVSYNQTLKEGDMVLLDMGATVEGYYSDITRTYIFGTPTRKQCDIWELERIAQDAVFNAAQIGATCESLDVAARNCLEEYGLGPGYKTPGLPHRTGHGLGLAVHEHPYIVKGNKDILSEGMCFSNEPMICIYEEFGVRLEDHIYMTGEGPEWFTNPAHSIDDPFGECR